MARNDDLRAEIKRLEDTLISGTPLPGGLDARIIMGFGTATRSIIKLEETSYFLTWVNIILAGLLVLFGGLQIYIMLEGH